MLHELYPQYEIVYEFPLVELGQRIDIYIPQLGIALEYQGRQHSHLVSHFHKSVEDFKYQLKLDQQKKEYLYLRGIKVIYIEFDAMVKSSEDLKKIIDETSYPDGIEFNPLPLITEVQEETKNKLRAVRKESMKRYVVEEDYNKRKERLDKERQIRKERYKKWKEQNK